MGKNIFKGICMCFIISISLTANLNYTIADEKFIFDSLLPEDGLSQGNVTSILEDSKNNVWIGTQDGLNRYNGYDFKVYKYDEKNENSISNNSINQIKEDNNSNLWILTGDGISRMNIETEIIKNYNQFSKESSLNFMEVNDILIAQNNDILLATSRGIYIYDEKTDYFIEILDSNPILKGKNVSNQYVYSLQQDNTGDIWVSTKTGLGKLSSKYEVIDYLNNNFQLDLRHSLHKIYYDKEGYIWGITYNDGLFKIDIKTNQVKKYVKGNEDNDLPSSHITDVLRDKYNNLWIGTMNGLAKYNDESDDFVVYKSNPYNKNSLLDSRILSISQNYSGSIWIGTYSGLSIFHPKDEFYNYSHDVLDENSISSNRIKSIYEDESGFIWLATDKNIIDIIDRKNNKVHHLDNFKNLNLDNKSINYITGKGDLVYISTVSGLAEIDTKEEEVKIYTEEDGLLCNNIDNLLLDSRDYLWIATKKGINILNTKDGTIINLEDFIGSNILEDAYIGDIFEDSRGDYYIGYANYGGLVKLDVKNQQVKVYKHDKNNKDSIESSAINSIAEDKDGYIWLATRRGLNKFDRDSEKFIRYNSKQGLINNNLYGVVIDKNNKPWVRSNLGISAFNTEKEIFVNIKSLDVLEANEFSRYAQYINKDGIFFLGGENGLNVFDPKSIDYEPLNKRVILDYFEVNSNKYKDISNMKFDYDENNIDMNFYLPSYKNTKMSTYKYSLEGGKHKGNWYSTNNTNVSYNNLVPGNYTFKVKVDDYDGLGIDESIVTFTINPPIWKSNIAKFIYLLIAVFIIYVNIRKVRRLNDLVRKRKLQLENEREVSETLLKNIIELEKNKNRCFVNLSYELRTPITMINGTVQLVNQINKIENGISTKTLKYHIEVINKNCKRLLGVINNIIDSTKLENDSYIITLEEKDIVYVVEEAALGLKEHVESKGLELIIDTDVEEKIVNCDEIEIERCIVNLIDNARKFTPRGGYIKLNIRDLNDKVEISVTDNGIGIEKDKQANIFDRFSQVIDMKKDALKGGSGLGLTITKQIIKKHNGIIYLESEEGKGSKFVIILPTNIF